MLPMGIDFISELWLVLMAMAPYLLFGFFIAGLLSVLVSPKLVEKHLGGKGISPVWKSALLGVPLPLCSCGVIPVAASLRKSGASKAAVIAFLISTPQTGIDSIMVTYSLLGPVFALFRPLAAFFTGIIGGHLVECFQREKAGEISPSPVSSYNGNSPPALSGKVKHILKYGFLDLPQDIVNPLLAGLAVAALVSVLLPDDLFAGALGGGLAAMLILMAAGIPIYVCATASVPIAAALIMKGISPGAAFVFLVTGPATNAATLSIVWKVLGKKTALIYLTVVAIGALAAGLMLDSIYQSLNIPMIHHIHSTLPLWLKNVSVIILLAVLFHSLYRKRYPLKSGVNKMSAEMPASKLGTFLKIKGMTCSQCAMNVKLAISECPGVDSVEVDLNKASAKIIGQNFDLERIKQSVEASGYKVVEK